ncbi:hypothetical protein DP116_17685 [Brasilonema bromeliae SPC951]|uniref:Uncharacterized protein n=2 Tax=Bromeliae group (in: Brasilonema) TaxID=3398495 RepID=A0ABX1P9S8_9CYAN|nr:hypothetical protein [Brasilonema bromeliae SPC951]
MPQQNYQQPAYPAQDASQTQAQQGYGQQPAFGNISQPIQPNQVQGFPVSQQAPGQLPPQNNMQYGQAQASAPATQPGWTADYPNPNEANNMAAQVPMDTAHKKGGGVGSMLGKALGGVAKMAPTVAGAGMAGMTNMAVGNMMMNGGYGMPYGGGYGMPYGMGGMGGGYGMPYGGMGMGGMGMGMGGMGMM